MQPIVRYEHSLTLRAIKAIHPVWSFMASIAPRLFGVPEGAMPHPSAMQDSPNWIWRLIFPRFFRRISVDAAEVKRLSDASKGATVVYMAKYAGQLEYSFFNHLFLDKALPLAAYTNAVGLRRWMKPRALWRSIASQEDQISKHGRVLDPLYDGYLPRIIAEGASVFIRIPAADLLDEELILTGPLRALTAVIEAQCTSGRPIVMVPVDFLWSRRPPKAKRGVRDILLGEQGSPGVIRKFFLFWRNYRRRAHATIGNPIDVAEFMRANADAPDEETLARRLRESLLGELKTQRQTITGPPMRPRSWFIQEVLSDDDLDKEICQIAAGRKRPVDDLRDLAHRYAREIVADMDHAYVELLERMLGRAFSRIFESFDVDEAGLARAKAAFAKGPVILVPNHKSHVDYLILSYVLYHNGMTVPHIAAGTNLSFWPLGMIFRRCGAYFIRRAFRDNPLYRAVLETYLKVLLKEGVCQEFFIEGGRSRTGKLKRPKMGMLGMFKRAARDAGVRDAQFLPVSVTYDRVIEQRSYVKEQRGEGKRKERAFDLFGLTKFLGKGEKGYGSIYVRFGEPIPVWSKSCEPKLIAQDAYRICHEINRRTVVTPAAVAAAAILPVSRCGVTMSQFRRNSKAILGCLTAKGAEIPKQLSVSPEAVLQDAVMRLAKSRLITPKRDALEPFIAVEEGKRVPLSFLRNGIVHFLTTVGVLSKFILWHAKNEEAPAPGDLARDLASAKELLHHELRFSTSKSPEEHAMAAAKILEELGAIARSDDGRFVPRNSGLWLLDILSAQIRPFVETLWVATKYVEERVREPVEERSLIESMLAAGDDMYQLGRVRFRESITRTGFVNALRALTNFGVLALEPQREGTKRHTSYVPTGNTDALANLKVELEKLF